jgi:hypothetical protein
MLVQRSHEANLRRYGRSLAGGRVGVVDPWLVAACAARVDTMLDIAEVRIARRGTAPRWETTRSALLAFRDVLEAVEAPLATARAHQDDIVPLRRLFERQLMELSTQCNHRAPGLVSPELLDRLIEALTAIDDRLAVVGELRGMRDDVRALRVEVRSALAAARGRRSGLAMLRENTPRGELLDLFRAEAARAERIVAAATRQGPARSDHLGLRRISDRLAESDWQLLTWSFRLQDIEMARVLREVQVVEQQAWSLWDAWRKR